VSRLFERVEIARLCRQVNWLLVLDTVEVSHGGTALPASQLDSLASLIGEWHAISLRH